MSDVIFVSNTLAGCANQHYFQKDGKSTSTYLSFYKIHTPGSFNYSLTFCGILDGTFRGLSFPNELCDSWEIISAEVASANGLPFGEDVMNISTPESYINGDFLPLTFDGETGKKATPERFSTDPIRLSFEEDEYLCLRLKVKGERIPCHPEVLIPIYEKVGDSWQYTINAPLPCKIGCDRPAKKRIGFFGDSITQGCGTSFNAYEHWNAVLSDLLGDEYSYWNLGIGYGRAADGATLGSWYSRAKECDIVFLCFGVNDLNADRSAEDIADSLNTIIDGLKASGCEIILQTPPPFDYPKERAERWQKLNGYVLNDLSKKALAVFDTRTVLSLSEEHPEMAKYGGHPNGEGCSVWAHALYEKTKHLF